MFLILTLQYAVEATCIEIGQVVSLYCEFAFIRNEVEQLDVRGRNENSLVAIGGNHLN
jgi:hypothetical protein